MGIWHGKAIGSARVLQGAVDEAACLVYLTGVHIFALPS
jgi:hypothetical protein